MSITLKFDLEGAVRETTGKATAKALRKAGLLPAIIYGKNFTPITCAINAKQITAEYLKGTVCSKVAKISLGNGRVIEAVATSIALDPVTDNVIHVDFLNVLAGEKVKALVKIRLTNQERSLGIKRGGNLNISARRIALLCDPSAIPEFIDIDLSAINIGQSVHSSDITLPEGAKFLAGKPFTILAISGRKASADADDAATATTTATTATTTPVAAAKK